jgi:hypothetical protein
MSPRFTFLCIILLAAPVSFSQEVDLTITEPAGVVRRRWPVTSGIPFAQGELRRHAHVALFNSAGVELPLQTEVLSRWPDRSIRWLLLDFQIDLAANQTKELALVYGSDGRRSDVPDPIRLNTRHDSPYFYTGPLRIQLSPNSFRLLDAVWLDRNGDGEFTEDERVTDGSAAGIVLVGPNGKRFRADLSHANMTMEQLGPMRACVRIDGDHRAEDDTTLFRYVVRMHIYRGQPFVKFEYTFINDDQQSLMSSINAVDLVCRIRASNDGKMVLNAEQTDSGLLYQVDDQFFEVNGQRSDGQAPGWAAVGSERGGMAIGVRQFWQNWPKSLEVAPGELRIGICPDFEAGSHYDGHELIAEAKHYYYLRDGVYTFKIGLARTHEMWANFFSGEPSVDDLSDFYQAVEQPLLAQFRPEYVCATGVVGEAPPADPKKYHGYDAWLDRAFAKHLHDQVRVRENGMLNFGDWWDETKFGGGWGNQEYDTSHIFFTQYLRTGDRGYFDRASQGAWHLMDVDTLHAANTHIRQQEHQWMAQPGQIWTHSVGHTGGYYDGASLEAAIWYQRGYLHDFGHVWIGGLCDWYTLTGNRRALDVLRLISNRVASECPTQYSDHIRDVGWPLNLMVTAYELTGDDKYLAAADRQWQMLKENLDPERGWIVMLAYGHCTMKSESERCRGQNSYMLALVLSALARYQQINDDPEVLQSLSVGLDQMIRECWDEEAGSFYPNSCVHQRDRPPAAYAPTTLLSSLAFAHEISRTGNKEHQRIFRKAFQTSVAGSLQLLDSGNVQSQAGYGSRAFHFTSYGLKALED